MPSRVSARYRDSVILQRPAVASDVGTVASVVQLPTGEIDKANPANWINLETNLRAANVRSMSLRGPEGPVNSGSGGESYFSDQVRAVSTHVCEIRRDSVTTMLDATCRMLWSGMVLNIKGINDSGPKSRELIIALKSDD